MEKKKYLKFGDMRAADGDGIIVGVSENSTVFLDTKETGGKSSVFVVDANMGTYDDIATNDFIPMQILQAVRRGESIIVSSNDKTYYKLFAPYLWAKGYNADFLSFDPYDKVSYASWLPIPYIWKDSEYRDLMLDVTATTITANLSMILEMDMIGDIPSESKTFAYALLKLLLLNSCFDRKENIRPLLLLRSYCYEDFQFIDYRSYVEKRKEENISQEECFDFLEDFVGRIKENKGIDRRWSKKEKEAAKTVRTLAKDMDDESMHISFQIVVKGLCPIAENFYASPLCYNNTTFNCSYVDINDPRRRDTPGGRMLIDPRDVVMAEKTALFIEYDLTKIRNSDTLHLFPYPSVLMAQLFSSITYVLEHNGGKFPVKGLSIFLANFSTACGYVPNWCDTMKTLQDHGAHIFIAEPSLGTTDYIYGETKLTTILRDICAAVLFIAPANFFFDEVYDTLHTPWLGALDELLGKTPLPLQGRTLKCAADVDGNLAALFPVVADQCSNDNTVNVYVIQQPSVIDHPDFEELKAEYLLDDASYSRYEYDGEEGYISPTLDDIEAAVSLSVPEGKVSFKDRLWYEQHRTTPAMCIRTMPLFVKRKKVPLPGKYKGKYMWVEQPMDCSLVLKAALDDNTPKGKSGDRIRKLFRDKAFRARLVLVTEYQDKVFCDSYTHRVVIGRNTYSFAPGTDMARFYHKDEETGRESFYLHAVLDDLLYHDADNPDRPILGSMCVCPFAVKTMNLVLEIAPGLDYAQFKRYDLANLNIVPMAGFRSPFKRDEKAYLEQMMEEEFEAEFGIYGGISKNKRNKWDYLVFPYEQ